MVFRCFSWGLIMCFAVFSAEAKSDDDSLSQMRVLKIHGSNTIGEKFAPELIEDFLQSIGFSIIDVKSLGSPVERKIIGTSQTLKPVIVELFAHGSSTGFEDLIAGSTDIAMSSRPIRAQETESLGKIFPSFKNGEAEHVVAYDALAIMVHPDNPIRSLSVQQLADIFAGTIANWKELGGNDSPIRLFARDDKSGTYDTFKRLVLTEHKVTLSEKAERFESSFAIKDLVRDHKNAIGFVGISHTGNNKVVPIAKELGASGILPNKFSIGTEDYPLSRKLFMYLPKETPSELAKQFIQFVSSNDGQKLATSVDLISFYPTTSKPRFKGVKLERKYENLLMYGQRLSVVFRLEDNKLDTKAVRDIERLISFKKQNPYNRLVLAGFWNDPAKSEEAKSHADKWMTILQSELTKNSIDTWEVFGGFLPIEDNALESGQRLNRRVEVWVL